MPLVVVPSDSFSTPPVPYWTQSKTTLYRYLDFIIHEMYCNQGCASVCEYSLSLSDLSRSLDDKSSPIYSLIERVHQVVREHMLGHLDSSKEQDLRKPFSQITEVEQIASSEGNTEYISTNKEHLILIYQANPYGNFFANTLGNNECVLSSLEEEVRNSPFNGEIKRSVRILEEALAYPEHVKDEPNFSFLDQENPEDVRLLFGVVGYFGLEKFQEKYLEPFNKKFPAISLSEIPPEAKWLLFDCWDDFTEFGQIPSTIKKLSLCGGDFGEDLCELDFSHLLGLEELHLENTVGITAEKLKQFPYSLKKLWLTNVNTSGYDLLHFRCLEEFFWEKPSWSRKKLFITPEQISQLSPTLIRLALRGADVGDFSFSHLVNLELLDLNKANNVKEKMINQLKPGIKILPPLIKQRAFFCETIRQAYFHRKTREIFSEPFQDVAEIPSKKKPISSGVSEPFCLTESLQISTEKSSRGQKNQKTPQKRTNFEEPNSDSPMSDGSSLFSKI